MRTIIVIFALLSLTGCETSTHETPNVQITPLTAPVEIGTFPVHGAVATTQQGWTVSNGFNSASLEAAIISQFDISHTTNNMTFSEKVMSVSVGGRGLESSAYDEAREELAAMEGFQIQVRLNKNTGQSDVEVSGGTLSPADREAMRNQGGYYEAVTLSGKTLQQGQEAFSMDVATFMGGGASDAEMVGLMTARVIGQAIYKGRPVIVCKLVGLVGDKTQKVPLDGVFYIDTITGANIYMHASASILQEDGYKLVVTMGKSVNLSPTTAMRANLGQSTQTGNTSGHTGSRDFPRLWYQNIAGKYEGTLVSAGQKYKVETVFTSDPNGAIQGQYTFHERGKEVTGRLYDFQPENDGSIYFSWQDRYGTGKLKVTFLKSLQEFHGSWGTGNSVNPNNLWNGKTLRPSETTNNDASPSGRLAQLRKLYEQGLITEGEYGSKRKKILDEL